MDNNLLEIKLDMITDEGYMAWCYQTRGMMDAIQL